MTASEQREPTRELPGTDGPRPLLPLRADRLLVLFYQEDGTPACTTELCSFRDEIELLHELGAELVGVSVDNLESHRAFLERIGGLPFPLLCDAGGDLARAFGVWDAEARRAQRAAFVLDRTGAVRHAQVPYSPSNIAQYEAIFRALGLSDSP